jgi:AsnC-type helix-turn-helix domain
MPHREVDGVSFDSVSQVRYKSRVVAEGLEPHWIRKRSDDQRIDELDSAIVGALQDDASLQNKDLAARLGIAASTCLERVRRLHRQGVLRG